MFNYGQYLGNQVNLRVKQILAPNNLCAFGASLGLSNGMFRMNVSYLVIILQAFKVGKKTCQAEV